METISVRLREAGLEDVPALDALLKAAFRRDTSYTPRLLRFLALGPGDWLVAEEAGRQVGMGGVNVVGGTAYVALVAVDPSFQRRGIATLVMKGLLARAAARGCGTVLLDASDAGRPVYEKLGFVAEDLVGLWTRPVPAEPDRGRESRGRENRGGRAAARVVTLESHNASVGAPSRALPSALANLDRECWGEDRSRFLSAYASDALSPVGIAGEPERPDGYIVLQAEAGIIGPWVCRDELAARALLEWLLTLDEARRDLAVYLPAANAAGAALLREAGFRLERSETHMRLGPALPPLRRLRVYSQFSFALG